MQTMLKVISHTKFLFIALILFNFGSIIKTDAQNDINFYYKALGEIKYGNIPKAQSLLDSAIQLNNKQDEYYIEKGKLLMQINQYRQASKEFLKAFEISANPAAFYLAKCYSERMMTDSSLFFLKKYMHWNKKESEFEVKNDSDFVKIKNTEQWKKFWQKNYYTSFQIDYNFALYKYKYNDPIDALDEVNKLIKKYKTQSEGYYLKAKILYNASNYSEASKQCSKAIKLNNYKAEYYLLLARIYNSQKKYEKAVEQYEIYLSKNPFDVNVLEEYSIASSQAGEYDKALENIKLFCDVFYKDSDAKYKMAEIAYDAGEYLLTIKIINKLMQNQKPTAEYYRLRGLAYLNTNTLDRAFYDLSQALDINPQIPDVLYYRGNTAFKQDNIQQACIDWKKAMDNGDYRPMDEYYKHCK